MRRAFCIALCALAFVSRAFSQFVPAQNPPNESARLVKTYPADPESDEYTLHWYSRLGWTYFFQMSEDFVTWTYLPFLIDPGTGAANSIGFELPGTDRTFLRLRAIEIASTIETVLSADFDGDKVSNGDEINTSLGTDPLVAADTDNDGMSDDWETRYGLNPHSPVNDGDAGIDTDGDGMTNLEEYQNEPFATDPTDWYNSTGTTGGEFPIMEAISGNAQHLEAGTISPEPLVIELKYDGTTPVDGGLVTLSIEEPGLISPVNNGTGFLNTLNLSTGTNGRVSVYIKCSASPLGGEAFLQIQARIGSTAPTGRFAINDASNPYQASAQVDYTYPAGTVGLDATQAIDSRLAGKDATALPVFSTQTHTATPPAQPTYVRNTSSWCYDLRQQMTCISPWNSEYHHLYAGTAITAQHFVNAKHAHLSVDQTIRFITANNPTTVVTRTIIGKYDHPVAGVDVTVYTLSSPLPATITPCKVLPAPADYADYLSYLGGGRPPVMYLDQEEKALVHELRGLDDRARFAKPVFHTGRLAFYEDLVNNDSGNPAFLVINDELVLLSCATTTTYGRFVSNLPYPTLNDMIAEADADAIAKHPELLSKNTGLQVQTADLSGFSTFTSP